MSMGGGMNPEQPSFEAMLPVVLGEARRRRVTLAVVFAAIAVAALVLGLLWPRKYMASTTILAQESSIIPPLMEGAAKPVAQKTVPAQNAGSTPAPEAAPAPQAPSAPSPAK